MVKSKHKADSGVNEVRVHSAYHGFKVNEKLNERHKLFTRVSLQKLKGIKDGDKVWIKTGNPYEMSFHLTRIKRHRNTFSFRAGEFDFFSFELKNAKDALHMIYVLKHPRRFDILASQRKPRHSFRM